MQTVIAVVIALTIFTTLAHRDWWGVITKGLKFTPRTGLFVADSLLPIYSITNCLGLAFCLYVTGGAYQSPYTAFLLIIVPVTISLGERRGYVACYSVLTIAIFCATLKWHDLAFQPHPGNSGVLWWYAVIGAVCAAFPAFLYYFQDNKTA